MKSRAALAPVSSLFRPHGPMRRINKDRSPRARINPPAFPATARENKLIDLTLFDHAEPQIAIKRCGCYRLPVGHDSALCKERAARALIFVKRQWLAGTMSGVQ